jgi:hypothetical protein
MGATPSVLGGLPGALGLLLALDMPKAKKATTRPREINPPMKVHIHKLKLAGLMGRKG